MNADGKTLALRRQTDRVRLKRRQVDKFGPDVFVNKRSGDLIPAIEFLPSRRRGQLLALL